MILLEKARVRILIARKLIDTAKGLFAEASDLLEAAKAGDE
jgi:hypothetical protein